MNFYLIKHLDQIKSNVCGMAMLNPGWTHLTRLLENESVLIFGKKGTVSLEIDGNQVEVKPGRMVLLPAGKLHKGSRQIETPASYYWIHFYTSIESEEERRYFLPKLMDEKEAQTIISSPAVGYQRLESEIILPLFFDVENSAKFENQLNQILQEYKAPGFSRLIYRNLVEKLLLDFSAEIYKAETKTELVASDYLVHQVILIIQDELSNPNASVKFFADKLNVNSDYLGRCFKEAMKISVGQYVALKRNELACSRLRETSNSIEEILVQCGYGSRRQFYDEFKKYNGKTPAAYRKECSFININSL